MKLKTTILASALLALGLSSAQASITIVFNAAFAGGVSSSLANSAGVASNGLTYGILVDTTGNGFLASYNGFIDSTALISGATTTDDFFFAAADLTSDASQGGTVLEGDFSTPANVGGVTGVSFLVPNGSTVTANDNFLLVWISGDKVGTLSDASFILPADGGTVVGDAPFVGVDPTRTAGLAYAGTSPNSTGAGITIVPEPSAVLLGAVGALGLLRRRRN
ncbi:MAG: PEP-CTERM sorting domain-containing protein [Cytophagaceae bacterium]|nr:MAG: PEP-CTERM sorting domain-containing protein [Cytophagaceae bacterium]